MQNYEEECEKHVPLSILNLQGTKNLLDIEKSSRKKELNCVNIQEIHVRDRGSTLYFKSHMVPRKIIRT